MVPESRYFDFFAAPDFDDPEVARRIGFLMLPLSGSMVSAGFISPADDYIEDSVDLNRYLIRNPSATFYARVKGNSMINAGVNHGDLIIVDRSLTVKRNSLCMCIVDGEFTLKFLRKENGKFFMVPANPAFNEVPVVDGMDFQVWGVALHVIRTVY